MLFHSMQGHDLTIPFCGHTVHVYIMHVSIAGQAEGTQLEYSHSEFINLTQTSSFSTSMNVALPEAVVLGSEIIELTVLG